MINLRRLHIGKILNQNPSMLELYLKMPQPLAKILYRSVRATIAKDQRQGRFDVAFRHIAREGIQGDYLEFGVFRGASMMMAYRRAMRENLRDMRFFAFDSFAGLPSSEGNFEKGTMACQEQHFLKLLAQYGMDLSRVTTVKGWYNESLTDGLKRLHALTNAAIVNVDCDLYESTQPVLAFLADILKPGSIVMFDDWYHFAHEKNPEQYGEERAFLEWPESKNFQLFYDVPGCSRSFVRI
jgi:O-methyltransferase